MKMAARRRVVGKEAYYNVVQAAAKSLQQVKAQNSSPIAPLTFYPCMGPVAFGNATVKYLEEVQSQR